MARRLLALAALAAVTGALVGCSGSGAGRTGFSIGKNLFRKDSNLKIYLDGQEAVQSKLKKGLTGYAPFEVKESVSTSPVFRYEVIDPKEFGYIKSTGMQIHQKFDEDYSDIAEYIIAPRDKKDCMKAEQAYELGDLGDEFLILDRQDNQVSEVELEPGREYLLVFTVQADDSEAVQVFFTTK
jgi:hypothetical protein